MDLIYTDTEKQDVGVLHDFSFDLAFGSDENDFELTVSQQNHVADAGCYIYIQGTEYGGLIDAVTSDSGSQEVTYSGRSWHGLLNSKILEPDAGQRYLIVSGDANTILSGLITRMEFSSVFTVSAAAAGITLENYKFDRYIPAYNGILKMLASVDAKLRILHDGTNVVLSAVPINDYTQDGIDNDQTTLTVKKTKNKVNHLLCLGSATDSAETSITVTVTADVLYVRNGPGSSYSYVTSVTKGDTLTITEVQDVDGVKWGKYTKGWVCLTYTNYAEVADTSGSSGRMVIHLYADENGTISRQQTFTGADEYAAIYDYANVESEEELIEGGTKRLKELLQQDYLAVDFPESDDGYDVGDIVGATDNITGISIAVTVTKKIVRIEGDNVTISIETNSEEFTT